jgi:hypothetical protein
LLAAAVSFFARRSSTADSPWFWVFIFSTAATVALFVMGGKYNHRQGHLEDQYRFGTRTLQKPPAGGEQRPPNAQANLAPLDDGPQPATHELLISLAPLKFLAIAAMIVSWSILQWRRVRGAQAERATG